MLDPVAMGTAVQADLAAVGFDVEIKTFEWNAFLGEVNPGLEGKADMAEMAWMTNDPDTLPCLALLAAWPDKGGFNSDLCQPKSGWVARSCAFLNRSSRKSPSLQRNAGRRSRRCSMGVCRQLETKCGDEQQGTELLCNRPSSFS